MGDALPAPEADDLLLRAVAGDRVALRAVAEQHWPLMRRWAYLELGDRTLAEDAVQEALVRLVRFIGRYDPARPFVPWLRTLVRNACRDAAGRRARVAAREVPEIEGSAEGDLDHRLDLHRLARRALQVFRDLTGRQRELLDLVDRGGLSPAEAADRLGISASAARSQLVGARRAVRSVLLAEGGADVIQLLRDR